MGLFTSFLALDTIACSSRDYLPKRYIKITKKIKKHKILQKNKLVVPERKLLKIKLLKQSNDPINYPEKENASSPSLISKFVTTNQDASSHSTRCRPRWWPPNCSRSTTSRSPANCCCCCSSSSSSTASCSPTARSW